MTEADRMHEALRTAFERICGIDGSARFDRRAGYDLLVFPPIPVAQFNGVWPFEDDAAPALEEALAEIAQLSLPSSVQLRGDMTPTVAEEARALGLSNDLVMPGMVAGPDELASADSAGLTISRVEDTDELRDAMATAAAGFGAPMSIFEPLYSDEAAEVDGLAYYLGRVDGTAVSTSVGFTLDGTVGIFNVATPAEHRGRGFGAALTVAAALDAFNRGADLAWLQSSAMGLPVYRRLGFREVERYVLLTRPEAG